MKAEINFYKAILTNLESIPNGYVLVNLQNSLVAQEYNELVSGVVEMVINSWLVNLNADLSLEVQNMIVQDQWEDVGKVFIGNITTDKKMCEILGSAVELALQIYTPNQIQDSFHQNA